MISPAILLLCAAGQIQPGDGFEGRPAPAAWALVESFTQANPGVAVSERAGRISRVYGRAFSQGVSAEQSAATFLQDHAAMFGVQPQHLVAVDDAPVQPVMYQPQNGTYKFTRYAYRQELQGVPVFRSVLKLLVRNEPGFPLVLASADLHDLGGFQVDPQVIAAPTAGASTASALQRAEAMAVVAGEPQVLSTRRVIWAGVEDMIVAPRLADATLVAVDVDRWLVLTDAVTGDVLFEEQQIHMVDVVGTVEGRATEGLGAEQCEAEVAMPLPYLFVTGPGGADFTDVDGNFVVPNGGAADVTINASLNGQWFDVTNMGGGNTTESELVTPPGPANLLFNAANTSEQVRAQVNAYLYSNVIRDYVLQYNPAYPTLNFGNFEVNVNRTDGVCPGNAWYSPGGPSINFCLSSGGLPNTAFASVIYHEYGHHLVQAGGSGQCEYGEGMSDVMSVLLFDDPNLGLGFGGNCNSPLRDADNTCQYSPTNCTINCGGPCHSCGRLISGVVWSLRNELIVTEPADYRDILSTIAINAILVHSGSSIEPDIAVDYLVLDDDDADLANGTPHYTEIVAAFDDHGLFEASIQFDFPAGLPATVEPDGGTSVPVTVSGITTPPAPGTGNLHVDTGGGFVTIPMSETAPNEYDAIFPAAPCGQQVLYFFSAETSTGLLILEPPNGAATPLEAIAASSIDIDFSDDFETNQNWFVSSSAADGQWDRGVPISNGTCDRGNPGGDADESGQCYVTDNDPGTCNSDVDDGSTTLTSPILDASSPNAYIRYWRWFDSTTGDNPFQDIMEVEVSDDAGVNWVNLETVGPAGAEVSGGWFQKFFRVADFVDSTSQFRVRFIASDTDPASIVEAGVDGVEMIILNCGGGVPGDVDGDGIVGIIDFLAVIGNWGPCPGPCPPSCAPDLDGDCEVGINDFLIVLGNWTP